MTIGMRNGEVVIKSGSIAKGCGCCGDPCACVAPQQLRMSFSFGGIPATIREVVVTQAAYADLVGGQITGRPTGFHDDGYGPYPFERYYGVAGYRYTFRLNDPVLGDAPLPADFTSADLQAWKDKGNGIMHAGALLEIHRRPTDQEGAVLYPRDSNCFYVQWNYTEWRIVQLSPTSLALKSQGAYSGFVIVQTENGSFTSDAIPQNFLPRSPECCIGEQTLYGMEYEQGVGYGIIGSGNVFVVDCA